MKSYIQCLDEISENDLLEGLLGYGMFSEKLPPIFSSIEFYRFWIGKTIPLTKKGANKYICFESMRNNNIPRQLGIPNPFKYAILCDELYENWSKIRDKFRENTLGDRHKISRIHIRKCCADKALMKMSYDAHKEYYVNDDSDEDNENIPNVIERDNGGNALFSMNYRNWKVDGDPILSFILGKKYVVSADVSQCFPSIYTHAIAWSLAGKKKAKDNKGDKRQWYNKIDTACQNMRDGETHGILIGPHTSNLLSELLLTSVDRALKSRYDYIRNVDDYICYVESYDQAEAFLKDLELELRKYDLLINHKKTKIEKLPRSFDECWTRVLNDKTFLWKDAIVDFKMTRSYLDTAIQLMEKNGGNASSIFYAIKILGGNKLSQNAKEYCVKVMCHLAIIFPYLIPIMDEYVFEKFNASVFDIEKFSKSLYKEFLSKENFEALSYAIFYAVKYNFIINIDVCKIISSSSCISKLLAFVYFKKNNDDKSVEELVKEAVRLAENDFDENWLFTYEVLKPSKLHDNWKPLKEAGVSFLLPEYRY